MSNSWGYYVYPVSGGELTRGQIRRKVDEAVNKAVEQARKKWLAEGLPQALKDKEAQLNEKESLLKELSRNHEIQLKKFKQWQRDLEAWEGRLALKTAERKELEAGAMKDLLAALECYYDFDLSAQEIRERSTALKTAFTKWKELGNVPGENMGKG